MDNIDNGDNIDSEDDIDINSNPLNSTHQMHWIALQWQKATKKYEKACHVSYSDRPAKFLNCVLKLISEYARL
jgi:5,10-methylenetetrahydrofolate reductase